MAWVALRSQRLLSSKIPVANNIHDGYVMCSYFGSVSVIDLDVNMSKSAEAIHNAAVGGKWQSVVQGLTVCASPGAICVLPRVCRKRGSIPLIEILGRGNHSM